MENATKALIIAGSVLVAILLITMVIRILGSTAGTVDSAQGTMDATAITTFNSQFAGYLNKPLTVSQVNTLEQKILASNAVNKGKHKVDFINEGAGTYKAEDTDEDGYIERIYMVK